MSVIFTFRSRGLCRLWRKRFVLSFFERVLSVSLPVESGLCVGYGGKDLRLTHHGFFNYVTCGFSASSGTQAKGIAFAFKHPRCS